MLSFLTSTLCAQIGEKDTVEVNRYKNKIAQNIDSIIDVANDCEVIYSNNGQFKFIHLRTSQDSLVFIDANYVEDGAGYISYLKYEKNVHIFKVRGDGADNKPFYLKINDSGEKEFVVDY